MKINTLSNLNHFSGTVLIPVFETDASNNHINSYNDIEISTKLF
jgi:leucyl aminopeptidase